MAVNPLARALQIAVSGRTLDGDTMGAAVRQMMDGEVMAEPEAQLLTAGLLSALAARGEQAEEIAAVAFAMREAGARLDTGDSAVIDTCGTGGTGRSLFNCSTASALVVAAGGGKVAKHGNRTTTRSSGSADVLEAAGVALMLTPEQASLCLAEVGMVFLFAPAFHPAMRHLAPVRRAMGIRTVFNLAGPLTNPAGARRQITGVPGSEYLEVYAQALQLLGAQRALVVHSRDGLDEISPAAVTDAVRLADGESQRLTIDPADYGISADLRQLQVSSAEDSLAMIRTALGGQAHPAADMVALNAGAAFHVGGLCADLEQGVDKARQVLASGEALRLLQQLAAVSQKLQQPA